MTTYLSFMLLSNVFHIHAPTNHEPCVHGSSDYPQIERYPMRNLPSFDHMLMNHQLAML